MSQRIRTAIAADPALHRCMLRLRLRMPNACTLVPEFPGRSGFPAPQAVQVPSS